LTEPDLPLNIVQYLHSHNVTIHPLSYINCTTPLFHHDDEIQTKYDHEAATCVAPYPQMKIRWSRFPMFRDIIESCIDCIGPILISDVRDVFFQRDPFTFTTGNDHTSIAPVVGLQFYEEHRLMSTNERIVHKPISLCKGHDIAAKVDHHPMLCSGTTIGTREAMILYLTTMYEEMLVWIQNPMCHFTTNGDDQAIHNLLYYTNAFEFISTIHHIPITTYAPRVGLVNTVGVIGKRIWDMHKEDRALRGIIKEPQLKKTHYTGDYVMYSNRTTTSQLLSTQWLGLHLDLTDSTGRFINYDGSYSPIVHQYDRFSYPIQKWMKNMEGILYT
jgi:hypothetical protein